MTHARTAGEAILAAIAGAHPIPFRSVMLARRDPMGPSVAITIPRNAQSIRGEWVETVVVPLDRDHPMRVHRIERLRYRLERWREIEAMHQAHMSEREAADHDPETGSWVDDDMPPPAWRIHVPAVLRKALDLKPSQKEPMDLIAHGFHKVDGAAILMEDVAEDEGSGRAVVRRIRVDLAQGVKYVQGTQVNYLDISHEMPETMRHGIVGMPLRRIIDHPMFDIPGLTITAVEERGKGHMRLKTSRVHAMMGPIPEA